MSNENQEKYQLEDNFKFKFKFIKFAEKSLYNNHLLQIVS